MWRYELIGVALFLRAVVGKFDFEASRLDVPQSKKYYTIENTGSVPLPELSGLTRYNDHFLTLSDGGADEVIYVINPSPALTDTIPLSNVSNIDWEAIASDTLGNIYIGDIGNNLNRRKNLRIYKYRHNTVDTLKLSYAQQENFPPPPDKRNFDSEALFWHNGKLHLFSKNRGLKCVKHYIFSDQPGSFQLFPQEELRLNTMITGAAVSPDGELVVLSGYGKLYFFKMQDQQIFSNPVMLIETTRFGQNEAVAFIDNSSLLICNEAGKFYKVSFTLP